MSQNLRKTNTFYLVVTIGVLLLSYSFSSAEARGSAFYRPAEWLNRCNLEIESRIKGKTATTAKPWRKDNQYLSTSWAYGLNLTAVSLATGAPRGVAVTPRHVLYTKHYGWHPWPGQTISFLTMENRVVSRVVDQVSYLVAPQKGLDDPDVAVIRLNEDLPASITPMKLVFPSGLKDVVQYTCPVLRIDQENKALLVTADTQDSGYYRNRFFYMKPTSNFYIPRVRPYAAFYEPMVTGDSTSPSILIYRDQFGVTPFLIGQVTFAGDGNGPNHSALSTSIQSAIDSFGDTQSRYRLVFGPYEFSSQKTGP